MSIYIYIIKPGKKTTNKMISQYQCEKYVTVRISNGWPILIKIQYGTTMSEFIRMIKEKILIKYGLDCSNMRVFIKGQLVKLESCHNTKICDFPSLQKIRTQINDEVESESDFELSRDIGFLYEISGKIIARNIIPDNWEAWR